MKIKCPDCNEELDFPLLEPNGFRATEFEHCNKRFMVILDTKKGIGKIYEIGG